ncbi:MAG: PaaI family thioesterase [Spirochaetia bacterium]|nr:PaaI family thioesterase [Spirochaetia bacterium]
MKSRASAAPPAPPESAEERAQNTAIFTEMFGSFIEGARQSGVQIPPNSIQEFGSTFLEYEPRKRLVARFPALEKHANPLGMLQGGVIGALIDDTMGPLSFAAVRGPTTTLTLAVTYLRSVKCPDTVTVDARVTGRGRQVIHLEAEVFDSRGRSVARATSTVLSLKGEA